MKKLAVFLAALFLLPCLASCKKSKKNSSSVKTISEDSTWWNDSVTTISPDEIKETLGGGFTGVLASYTCPDEDSVILLFNASSEDGAAAELIRHYTYDGKLIGEANITDFFNGKDFRYDRNVFSLGEKYYAQVSLYDESKDTYVDYGYEIDFENGTLKDPIALELPETEMKIGGTCTSINSIAGVGDDLVYLVSTSTENGTITYQVFVNDGTDMKTHDLNFGRGTQIDYINNFSRCGDKVAFIAEYIEAGNVKLCYCTLDIHSFEINKTEMPLEFSFAEFYVDPKNEAYACEEQKIVKVDLSTGTATDVLDFNTTYIFDSYRDGRALKVTDNEIVIITQKQSFTGLDCETKIITLTKADKNPNAGRKVLSLAHFSQLEDTEYVAINNFNKTSENYFIEETDKYYLIAEKPIDDSTGESFLAQTLSGKADAMDLLISDIKSGDGPDLVIYDSEYEKLNNTDYLLDLTKRIESENTLNGGDYMDFVLSPNGRDGKHYRLDYKYFFRGLLVNNNFLDDGAKGLTFSQYDQIISDRNLGMSVLEQNKLNNFRTLLSSSDCFSYDDSGKISVNTEGFRSLAEYVASISDNMQYDDGMTQLNNILMLQYMGSREFTNRFGSLSKSHSIIGLPSSDGHAENVLATGIGITSCSALEEGAWEFMMTLLSSDIQHIQSSYDPVMKSAQKDLLLDYISIYNDAAKVSYDMEPIDEGMADRYIEQLSDAIIVPDVNPTVLTIICEEMPAYFAGDKTLDEVISTIENRVNLLLREQG
ncbi:MAG: hypothetical protein J5653_03005 [Clostridiales bacterium]|nr:hypothetical protein [Clostridiales bacterium]